MTLEKKGERNLKLAEILDSQEFLELSKFSKEHLCSVIINRLYYGVYLIGKGKLVESLGLVHSCGWGRVKRCRSRWTPCR